MKTRSLLVLAASLVAVVVLAVPAMAGPSTSAPTESGIAMRADDPASIRGFVTEKRDRTILVEERPCRRDGEVVKYTRCDLSKWRGEKGYFKVGERTALRDASGRPTLPAGYRDLKVGQVVRAEYRGAFRPSYPSEGGAKGVTILVQVARPQAG